MAALERPSQHICVFFGFFLFSHHSTFCQSEYLRESHSFEDTQRQPIQTWTSGFKLRSFRKRLKFHSLKTSTRKNQNSSPGFLFYFLLFLIFNFAVFENMDRLWTCFTSLFHCFSPSVALSQQFCLVPKFHQRLLRPLTRSALPTHISNFAPHHHHYVIHGDFSHWKHKICNRTLAVMFVRRVQHGEEHGKQHFLSVDYLNFCWEKNLKSSLRLFVHIHF